MNTPAAEMPFRWFAAATLVLLGCIASANSFTGEFVWDDASSILLHKHVQDPARLGQLFREDLHAFGRGQGNFYRPMLAVSFMADYAWAFDGRMEHGLSLIHISEPTGLLSNSYAVFCLKKKKKIYKNTINTNSVFSNNARMLDVFN